MASNVKQSGELAIAEKALPADYNQDFYSWLMEQAQHVRTGEWDAIDRDNLAEEIESLGREQFNKLESALRVLLIHFLKWITSQARDRGVGCCQSKSNGLNLRTCSTITPASSPESRKRVREPIARLGSKLPQNSAGGDDFSGGLPLFIRGHRIAAIHLMSRGDSRPC